MFASIMSDSCIWQFKMFNVSKDWFNGQWQHHSFITINLINFGTAGVKFLVREIFSQIWITDLGFLLTVVLGAAENYLQIILD
jgi:hypothetical protein